MNVDKKLEALIRQAAAELEEGKHSSAVLLRLADQAYVLGLDNATVDIAADCKRAVELLARYRRYGYNDAVTEEIDDFLDGQKGKR